MKTTTDREARAARGAKKTNHDHADELFQSHIGGAAMLEGVMMRGRYSWAVAVREPEGGIYLEEHDVPGYGKKQPWRRWPLVRGCVSLVESLVLQFKAMAIVADHAYDFSEDEDTDASQGVPKNPQCSNSPRTAQEGAAHCGTAPADISAHHAGAMGASASEPQACSSGEKPPLARAPRNIPTMRPNKTRAGSRGGWASP